jgi:hypothetical protein
MELLVDRQEALAFPLSVILRGDVPGILDLDRYCTIGAGSPERELYNWPLVAWAIAKDPRLPLSSLQVLAAHHHQAGTPASPLSTGRQMVALSLVKSSSSCQTPSKDVERDLPPSGFECPSAFADLRTRF